MRTGLLSPESASSLVASVQVPPGGVNAPCQERYHRYDVEYLYREPKGVQSSSLVSSFQASTNLPTTASIRSSFSSSKAALIRPSC